MSTHIHTQTHTHDKIISISPTHTAQSIHDEHINSDPLSENPTSLHFCQTSFYFFYVF